MQRLLQGDVGSGKTLFTTYCASIDTRPIYSNYKIKLDNYNHLKPETLAELSDDCLILIDEAYSWLESRTSGKDINRYLSYILFQSRKRGMDIMLTDQLVGTIDVRFRMLTNYEVYCQNILDVGFEYTIFKKSMYGNYKPKKMIMPYEIAETIFPLYDSWQLINPIDDNLIFNISEDKASMLKIADSHVKKLLAKCDGRKIPKGVISDYCLRNNLPKAYIDVIFNAIKSSILSNE
jgi:hypothetical protein